MLFYVFYFINGIRIDEIVLKRQEFLFSTEVGIDCERTVSRFSFKCVGFYFNVFV